MSRIRAVRGAPSAQTHSQPYPRGPSTTNPATAAPVVASLMNAFASLTSLVAYLLGNVASPRRPSIFRSLRSRTTTSRTRIVSAAGLGFTGSSSATFPSITISRLGIGRSVPKGIAGWPRTTVTASKRSPHELLNVFLSVSDTDRNETDVQCLRHRLQRPQVPCSRLTAQTVLGSKYPNNVCRSDSRNRLKSVGGRPRQGRPDLKGPYAVRLTCLATEHNNDRCGNYWLHLSHSTTSHLFGDSPVGSSNNSRSPSPCTVRRRGVSINSKTVVRSVPIPNNRHRGSMF